MYTGTDYRRAMISFVRWIYCVQTGGYEGMWLILTAITTEYKTFRHFFERAEKNNNKMQWTTCFKGKWAGRHHEQWNLSAYLACWQFKTFFFLKQTTKWSYFWAVKNDRKGVRPDLNSKRLSRHAQSCSICLIFFFLRKFTLVAMEPNVRDEITSVNRVPATNICVSRALHLNLQKKKNSLVELAVFKSKCTCTGAWHVVI